MVLITSKEVLERQVEEGKMERTEVTGLKGGKGKVIIYKNNEKYTDTRIGDSGYLLLFPGTIIGNHTHDNDSETLIVRVGKVEINGSEYITDEIFYCDQGQAHDCKNLTNDEVIVEFVKRN